RLVSQPRRHLLFTRNEWLLITYKSLRWVYLRTRYPRALPSGVIPCHVAIDPYHDHFTHSPAYCRKPPVEILCYNGSTNFNNDTVYVQQKPAWTVILCLLSKQWISRP